MPSASTANHELPVQTGVSAKAMAEAIFGSGTKVISATFKGDSASSGTFTTGDKTVPGLIPSNRGVILSTGYAEDFTNKTGDNNQQSYLSTDTKGLDGDASLNELAGGATYDGALFTTTFTSESSTLSMQVIFSSEEYQNLIKTGGDVVGIWVNGEQVKLNVGNGAISSSNINSTTNSSLYLDNSKGSYNTEMNGATVVLTLTASVKVGEVNTLTFGIADTGDTKGDSNLLIVGGSVQAVTKEVAVMVAENDALTLKGLASTDINLLANDTTTDHSDVHISALNGHAVVAGDQIVLDSGEVLTLNADGTLHVQSFFSFDPVTFSYEITDSLGQTSTASVTLTTDLPEPVDGTEGDDRNMMPLYVDAQGDIIDGSDGNPDLIFGYGGNDKIFAALGNDTIFGGTGNDFMRALDGNDLIYGGEGNDVLDGGAGIDTMIGGVGNDVYYIDSAKDVIVEDADAGRDEVVSSINFTLDSNFEDLWLRLGSLARNATGNAVANKMVGNEQDNVIKGLAGFDTILGGAGNDQIYGGAGNDQMNGEAGNDVIYGGEGADKLYGGAGENTLYGGAGNDSLTGSDGNTVFFGDAGNDIMGAGAGHDQFVFATGSGTDRIKFFELGQDQITLEGVDVSQVEISVHGPRLWIEWGTSDRIILNGEGLSAAVTAEDLGIGISPELFFA